MDRDLVVQARRLGKQYAGGVQAVAELDLSVRRGEVYGFLGRNGAGKTTTMRMLVGLVRPSSGSATVLGAPPGTPAALARVGALIESPLFYPHLSGRDNLRLLARYAEVAESRVDEVLEIVALTDRAKHRFRTYSLGMKQRIGVAAALLKDPELLILDEPTNGLDPAGVADMRELIRTIGHGRRTVLLSSHQLGEVEQVCDRIGVIQEGRLIAEGTMAELRARAGGGGLVLRADPVELAIEQLRAHPGVRQVQQQDGMLRVGTDPGLAADLNRVLVLAGVRVAELRPDQHSLEEIFFQLTDTAPAAELRTATSEVTR